MPEHIICNLCADTHYKVLYDIGQQNKSSHPAYLISEPNIIPPEKIVKCSRCGLIYAITKEPHQNLIAAYKNMADEDYIKEEKGAKAFRKSCFKEVRKI